MKQLLMLVAILALIPFAACTLTMSGCTYGVISALPTHASELSRLDVARAEMVKADNAYQAVRDGPKDENYWRAFEKSAEAQKKYWHVFGDTVGKP